MCATLYPRTFHPAVPRAYLDEVCKSRVRSGRHQRCPGSTAACVRVSRCTASCEQAPLRLLLCGASALTHDAVSSLLRLPALVHLDVAGCSRISAMDRMRLLAKIKAGRELHASGGAAEAAAPAAAAAADRCAERAALCRPLSTQRV